MICRLEYNTKEGSLRYGDKDILPRAPLYIVICEAISVDQCINFNTYINEKYMGVSTDVDTILEEFSDFLLSEP